MLWDLRTGSPILPISGHFQSVMSSDFHSDGYQLATSSKDNTIKVFDIRSKNYLATIPSHLKLVSDVKYEQKHSRWLASASYDGFIKVFSAKDYTERASIDCNGHKVSSVCVTLDQAHVLATSMEKKLLVFSKTASFSSHANALGDHPHDLFAARAGQGQERAAAGSGEESVFRLESKTSTIENELGP